MAQCCKANLVCTEGTKKFTKPFKTARMLRQGSCLSPTFFKFCLCRLLEEWPKSINYEQRSNEHEIKMNKWIELYELYEVLFVS